MLSKYQIIIGALALLVAFAVGRFLAPTKVKTEVKTVYVEKKTEDQKVQKHIQTVIVQKPDGSKETKITEDDNSDTKTAESNQTVKQEDKEVIRGTGKTYIAALAGLSISNFGQPVYGASVARSVLGPITVGAWGLTNGTAGLSVGLSF